MPEEALPLPAPEPPAPLEQPARAATEASPPPAQAPADRPPRSFWTWARENLETIVVAVVAALFIRQYVLEPYKIPTGSMAPGLHGVHRDIACPACRVVYETGCDDRYPGSEPWDLRSEASCPNCGTRAPLGGFPMRRGDKILANKLVYLLRPPRRWEVVVFLHRDGAGQSKTYIKRLAGLPGDSLEIRRGDLYANGRIAERPPEVLEAMRVPVYDLAQDRPDIGGERWRSPDPAQARREGGTLVLDGPVWVFLTYTSEITDWLCYNDWNKVSASKLVPVGDLRVEMDCELPPGAGIGCEIREDDQIHRWTLGAGGDGYEHALRDAVQARSPLPPLAPGRHRLVFSNIDNVQTLAVDGREAGAWTFPDADEGDPPASGLRILGHGGARVTALRVARDSAYSQDGVGTGGRGQPVAVPAGRYFFLGDNSLISADSRKWSPGAPMGSTVAEPDILGKAFAAAVHLDWPSSLESWRDLSFHRIR